MVQAMGTVIAAQEVVLQPRVTGEIVDLNPELVPGGRFKAGEVILQIDRRDYELAVKRTRSQVAQATYDMKMEQGQQEIAGREWELLDMEDSASDLDRELALRKPHLIKAEASLAAAEAAEREANLDLERTTIHAPFNCQVITETVDLGAQVNPQTQLARLVGTDEYWVQVSVPVDRLRWISFPDGQGYPGSSVCIHQQVGTEEPNEWSGEVVRLLGDLEPQGRMARVLVSVRDPLGLAEGNEGRPPLLIRSYVNVVIEGAELANVVAMQRSALRDGDQVWIMGNDGKLAFREPVITWRNRDTVLIRSGIEAGERLVVSDLPAPVEGMTLRLGDDGAGGSPEDDLVHPADEDVRHAQPE